jgi:long-chain acyl-CoA synthetase
MHLATVPDQRAAQDPGGESLADDRVDLDNAAFAGAVRALAVELSDRGVTAGDVVGVMLPNRAELVLTLFASWRLGATVTPVNPALTVDEAAYQLQDAGAKLLIADPATDLPGGVPLLDVADVAALSAVDPPAAPPVRAEADDLALLIYTSGTTGRPKGVMLDHANLTAMTGMAIEHFRMDEQDHSLLILPLFHVNGIVASVASPLRAGGHVTIMGRFSPETFWDEVERTRPTYFSGVPTIYAMLTALPADVAADTSSLRFVVCGAAPMPAELIGRFEDRFGVPLVEGYGLSEGTTASTINPLDGPRKPGTVGPALPGQEIAVIDAAGRQLTPGERGEVILRGANLMRGYLNKPQETAETLIDGWLRTGDVGYLDEDGYLVLVDRVKDMIIRGGENIYPKEIESVLYRHPAVLEAAVVGRPDLVFGEQVAAFVALRPGEQADADELIAHCRSALASYKVPRELTVLPTLPKNAVGKITKPPLRARLAEDPRPEPATT